VIPASKWRLISVALLVMGLLAVLAARLWYLQVDTRGTYVGLSAQDRIRNIVQPPVRGEILDDTGQPMVGNQSVLTVAVNVASMTGEPDGGRAELARLGSLLGISTTVLHESTRLCTRGVKQPCWPGSPYQPIPVAQNVSQQVALTILENKAVYPDVTASIQPAIQYVQPISTAAAQMVGYLQPITAQEVKQLHVPVTGFASDDLVGQSGLEAQYDKQLRGTTGIDEVSVSASGQVMSTIKDVKPQAGDDLVTSISPGVQVAAENALRTAILNTQGEGNTQATSGAAVVMTTTGRIVAMASYPTYDPSIWSGGISDQQFQQLFGTGQGEPVLERATQGQYFPGSTWKVTTTTAAINAGYPLDGTYDCPASITVAGITFNNDFANGGPMSLHDALVRSCDTVFYNFGYDIWLKDNRQYDVVTSPKFPVQEMQQTELGWGFGRPTGIDLPGEASGTVPTREWLYYFYQDNAHQGQNWCKNGKANGGYIQQIEYQDCTGGNVWTPGQAINAAIGQGYVAVTPLQLAAGYAALANGGTLYSPRIGEELLSPSGKLVQTIVPPVAGHLPASEATLAYIRNALQGVVTQGTAAGAFGGFPLNQTCVAGKTGTAQVAGRLATSVFASYAPCNNPQYVVVMMIPNSGYGADVSAPAIRQIWDAIYGLEGHPPALKDGQLPAPPTINSAGRVVPTAAQIGPGQPEAGLAGLAAGPGQAADIEPGGRRALGRPG
jgi:penicillin-binding protein 2